MLNLILAEASLELIPKEIQGHKALRSYARVRDKSPSSIILDKSYHYSAMLGLQDFEKRGRPDIVHITLLEALGSPLNKEGLLKIYIHTISDYVVYVNPKVRLPRNYNRFIGLMEQLFKLKKIPPRGEALLTLCQKTLTQLLTDIAPSYTVILSERGDRLKIHELAEKLLKESNPAVVIGGFPHGYFRGEILKQADDVVSIYSKALEAWVVASRIISAYEEAASLL